MNYPLVMLVLLGFLVLLLLAPFSALAGLIILLLVSALISMFWNLVRTAFRGDINFVASLTFLFDDMNVSS